MKTYSKTLGDFVEEYKKLVEKYNCMVASYDASVGVVAVSIDQGVDNGWVPLEIAQEAKDMNFEELDSCVRNIDKGTF